MSEHRGAAEERTVPDDPEPEPAHPATTLTELVHQRGRLGILSILSECGRADFSYLKSALGLTDGNLGRHLEILAGDGLIAITKGYEGRRPRTWARITMAGESALAAQMAAMKQLVRRFEDRQPVASELHAGDGDADRNGLGRPSGPGTGRVGGTRRERGPRAQR